MTAFYIKAETPEELRVGLLELVTDNLDQLKRAREKATTKVAKAQIDFAMNEVGHIQSLLCDIVFTEVTTET